jgi:hypothetical protein
MLFLSLHFLTCTFYVKIENSKKSLHKKRLKDRNIYNDAQINALSLAWNCY